MLKAAALALLAANLTFFGWSNGWFDGMPGAHADREPERLLRQVRPETIVVRPPAPPVAAASICLESGPVAEADSADAAATLAAWLPAGSWTDARVEDAAVGAASATHVYRVEHAEASTAARLGALRLGAARDVAFSPCAAAPAASTAR